MTNILTKETIRRSSFWWYWLPYRTTSSNIIIIEWKNHWTHKYLLLQHSPCHKLLPKLTYIQLKMCLILKEEIFTVITATLSTLIFISCQVLHKLRYFILFFLITVIINTAMSCKISRACSQVLLLFTKLETVRIMTCKFSTYVISSKQKQILLFHYNSIE